MAYITLPSGKRIDTSHISYMTHHEHTTEPVWPSNTGGTHRVRTLHMDNNDLIKLDGPDMDALDTALTNEGGVGGLGSVIVDNPDSNPVPINAPTAIPISGTVDANIKSRSRTPLGFQTITPTASTGLTVPAGATLAIIQNSHGTVHVRWRDDATAPTATAGMQLRATQQMEYFGDLAAIRFINEATGPTLNVSYYS